MFSPLVLSQRRDMSTHHLHSMDPKTMLVLLQFMCWPAGGVSTPLTERGSSGEYAESEPAMNKSRKIKMTWPCAYLLTV